MSIAILLIGFIAVVGALVYRAYRTGDEPNTRYAVKEISLPAGAELISASSAEGLITLAYKSEGTQQVRIVDGRTGELVGQFRVTAE